MHMAKSLDMAKSSAIYLELQREFNAKPVCDVECFDDFLHGLNDKPTVA